MENNMNTKPETLYTLRDLNQKDMYRMVKLVGKLGSKNLMRALAGDPEERAEIERPAILDDETMRGTDEYKVAEEDYQRRTGEIAIYGLLDAVLTNLDRCENEVNALLCALGGMTPAALAALDIGEYTGMVVDVIHLPGFMDFFTAALKLLQAKQR